MSSNSELACVYSALILHDDGVPITVGDELKLSECNSDFLFRNSNTG